MTTCVGPRCRAQAVQQHHVIYAQHIRRAGGRLNDPRVLVGVCVRCHERHHSGVSRFPVWALPDGVFEYAAELLGGLAAFEYLRRYYSSGDRRLDALLP